MLRIWVADVVDAGEPWARMSAKAIGPSRFFVVDRQVPEPNADTVRPIREMHAVSFHEGVQCTCV